jgi:NAD(P)-dependent dehydrogenase (short-subunit alcohol dehydrogenase family)
VRHLVTGGAGGIGLATVRRLAGEGHEVLAPERMGGPDGGMPARPGGSPEGGAR